jgi:hypothetical protein
LSSKLYYKPLYIYISHSFVVIDIDSSTGDAMHIAELSFFLVPIDTDTDSGQVLVRKEGRAGMEWDGMERNGAGSGV